MPHGILDDIDGQIVGDYGTEVVVRLPNGKEIAAYRDEVIVFD